MTAAGDGSNLIKTFSILRQIFDERRLAAQSLFSFRLGFSTEAEATQQHRGFWETETGLSLAVNPALAVPFLLLLQTPKLGSELTYLEKRVTHRLTQKLCPV